jgi:hypothetical protein
MPELAGVIDLTTNAFFSYILSNHHVSKRGYRGLDGVHKNSTDHPIKHILRLCTCRGCCGSCQGGVECWAERHRVLRVWPP